MASRKLPFKPTALRDMAPPSLDAQDKGKGKEKEKAHAHAHADNHDDDDGGGDHDDSLDLFRQSKAMAPILAADQERRMRRKLKQKQKQEQRRQSIVEGKRPASMSFDDDESSLVGDRSQTQTTRSSCDLYSEEPGLPEHGDGVGVGVLSGRAPMTPPSTKRSNPGSAMSLRSTKRQRSDEAAPSGLTSSSPKGRFSQTQTQTQSQSPAKAKAKAKALPGKDAPMIVLDSDSDDDVKPISMKADIQSKAKAITDDYALSFEAHGDDGIRNEPLVEEGEEEGLEEEEDEEDEEEDEFSEYVRRAQQQRDEAAAGSATTKNPPVWIMVTSQIPSTKPLLCKYLVSTALRVLRDTWVAIQAQKGIDLQPDDIILTWCRRKLYPSTSLLTLNIRPPAVAGGAPMFDHADRAGVLQRGFLNGGAQVLLEAWTSEGFSEMERQEQRRQRIEAGDEEEEEQQQPEGPEEQVQTCVVRLAARDLAPLEMTVPVDTTVGVLASEFRRRNGIGEGKEVAVWLEGTRLEESDTMAAVGDDEEVMLDIYIK